ncbi:hypothetical protein pmac_cds_727 [Pandoravirus macleodensis]|uniref:Uncharacterized protein n=1 Tax=Pandoravirus macleodensis TaxID=2107707 RepID=A0A2U7UG93_9VIRU|nr:hypothetical protein pmac_cds_727 [Pandoravirus macleodensis]AVK77415.1 hypothetical protein pmac_cds_727 [Pandoravirus macleodensis]
MSRTGEIMMATVFFNATQEVTAMPASGRYVLPEGTVPGTAVVFIARARGDAIPVPFAVEGADAPTRVTATKDGVAFTGDLVSIDAESLTLSTDAGITQTLTGYDDAQIQRRDRPTVIADATAAISEARVAFMRDGLSWRPSYLIYLGRGDTEQEDEPIIEQIVGAADIRNKSDRRVHIDHTWLTATRVPLPPGRRPATARYAPRPMQMAAAAAAAPMAMEEGATRSLAMVRAAPAGGDVDTDQEASSSNPSEAARYDLGALSMDSDSTVTVPLFVAGPPAEQAAVRFCLLPTGPTTPGERNEPLTRGYRFVTEQAMPPGRVTVFDPDMGFVGVADLGGAVAGEPVDLRLGPSTQVDVDVWVQVNTAYSPVDLGDDTMVGDDGRHSPDMAMLGHRDVRRDQATVALPTVVQVIDHVVVHGVVRNGTGRPVVIVLSYRPIVGGVITSSEPPCDRMTRGVAEWEATFVPGSTDLRLVLEVDRGQRIVTPSTAIN